MKVHVLRGDLGTDDGFPQSIEEPFGGSAADDQRAPTRREDDPILLPAAARRPGPEEPRPQLAGDRHGPRISVLRPADLDAGGAEVRPGQRERFAEAEAAPEQDRDEVAEAAAVDLLLEPCSLGAGQRTTPDDVGLRDGDDGHDDEPADPKKPAGTNARDRARIKALERQIADLTAKQADITKREAKLKRETLLRAAIEAASPVSVDDAFRILVADPALKESEDGQEFYVESDGAEVSLEAWAKKQIAARPHLQKPSGKGGGGNVPAGSAGGASLAIPKDLPPEERIRRWRAQQAANG